jgi:hypothetical protein
MLKKENLMPLKPHWDQPKWAARGNKMIRVFRRVIDMGMVLLVNPYKNRKDKTL